MKVSIGVKIFIYVGMNFGVLFFSLIGLVQGVSAQKIVIICVAAAAWINLMLWAGFRMREKGAL
jgi:uncharacterized membrane protein